MSFNLQNLLRENIKNLRPYSSARDEFQGEASIYLDANENAYGSPLETNYNRYPDPLQHEVKLKITAIKGDRQEIFFWETAAMKRLIFCSEAFAVPVWIT